MVGNKWRKWLAAGLLGLTAAGVLAGCGGPQGEQGRMKVGIVQIVQHPALDEANKGFVAALDERGLKDKIDIDQQNAQGDQSNLQSIANRFVSGNYALIGAISTPAAQSMASATSSIPIVGTAIADFKAARLMKSESTPDGNVTGTHDRAPLDKQIALIRKIQPQIKTLGIIYNSSEINSAVQAEKLKEACQPLGIHVMELTVTSVNDIQQTAEQFLGKADAVFVPTDNTVASSIPTLMAVTNKGKIPVYGAEAGHVASGAFASESISFYEIGHRAGEMAADILEGKKKIQDLPAEGPQTTKLYINRQEMELLGISVPEDILKQATMI